MASQKKYTFRKLQLLFKRTMDFLLLFMYLIYYHTVKGPKCKVFSVSLERGRGAETVRICYCKWSRKR